MRDTAEATASRGPAREEDGPGPVERSSPSMFQRISRFALQQRSRIDSREQCEGERRLMWAMLKDTLRCYHNYADATTVHGQRLFRDAERWIQARDLTWVFSFENVCAVLDIDSDYLRNELRRWRRVYLRRQREAREQEETERQVA